MAKELLLILLVRHGVHDLFDDVDEWIPDHLIVLVPLLIFELEDELTED